MVYFIAALLLIFPPAFWAAPPSADMEEQQRWVQAKFLGVQAPPAAVPHLEPQVKAGSLLKDRIQGHPLLIVDRQFQRGLAMRSPGEVIVKVPVGVRAFDAVVGVDSNDVGYYSNGGRGDVIASVVVEGEQRFKSGVLHEGVKGMPIHLDLAGAREFSLKLEAVGERPPTYQAEWDQVDWAEASAVLMNGTTLRLSDLPMGTALGDLSLDAPFSFVYGGHASAEFLSHWPVKRESRPLDEQRTELTSVYTDPETKLAVRCAAVVYHDFPVVEWTLYLKNGGSANTPILENIKALDTRFEGPTETRYILHHSKGSSATAADFQPLETALASGASEHFSSVGGRPTDGDMPYFNLDFARSGVIVALGWPGQWSLGLSRDYSTSIHVAGGQELTHFWLAPGEEVRTPLAVVQFWSGADWLDGQNAWRSWMMQHNLPRPGGRLPPPQIAASSGRYTIEMQFANEENQKQYLARTLRTGVPVDHWWMDAGWYPFATGWWNTGTWFPDPKRFPRGFRPISDEAHAKGVKIIVWFEPERVTRGSWLFEHHPEWLIGPDDKDKLLFLRKSRCLAVVTRSGQPDHRRKRS